MYNIVLYPIILHLASSHASCYIRLRRCLTVDGGVEMLVASIAFALIAQLVILYITRYVVMLIVREKDKHRQVLFLLSLVVITGVLWYNVDIRNWEFLLFVSFVCLISLFASTGLGRYLGGVYFGRQRRRGQGSKKDR